MALGLWRDSKLQPFRWNGFAVDGTNSMIEMGSASLCSSSPCSGISIEHLRLQVNSFAIGGIYNGYATSPSTFESNYVNDVDVSNFGATSTSGSTIFAGLVVDISAADSGPYSNLYLVASQSCGGGTLTCPPTACVEINTQTRASMVLHAPQILAMETRRFRRPPFIWMAVTTLSKTST